MKNWLIFLASGLLLIAIILAWWFQSRRVAPIAIIPSLTGQPEYCVTCHEDLQEISTSHPVKTFGCVTCHGGERLALDADLAHSSMRGGNNPSDLSVVEQSCGGGNCHNNTDRDLGDHIQRVLTSVQSTYAGAIAIVRYTFGAQTSLSPIYGTKEIDDTSLPSKTGILFLDEYSSSIDNSSSLQLFGENCLTCHLNTTGTLEAEHFGGCAACHSPEKTGEDTVHTLTTAIPYTQCNTCHNQGNYDLKTMTFVERSDQPVTRLEKYYQPISQFTQCEYTLDCVDCHTRAEVMGDGDLHANQADIQYVQCKTCHGTLTELPLVKTLTDPDDITFLMAQLNPVMDLQLGDTILVTEQGEPLWNTRLLPDGTFEMVGKATKQLFHFNPVMGIGCQQDPSKQESQYCHECHSVER